MVELRHQIQRLFLPVVGKHIQKFLVAIDPLRQRHRHPGSEPDEVQPGDSGQLLQIPPDDGVRVNQRVPAGNEDIGHIVMRFHISHGLIHPPV